MSLPSGYKRLEYIRFSGTQYLPSITIPQDFKIEVTLKAGNTGSYMNIYDHNFAKPMLWIDGNKILEMDTVKSGYTLGTEKVTIVSDSTGNSSVLSVNGTVVQTATKVTGTSFTVTLFNRAGSQCFVGDLFTLKVSSKTETIVDYVPCIDASGNVGVYDLVGKQFYGSAGAGTFTAGPVIAIAAVESEIKKLKYIQSSGTQYINSGFVPNQNTRVVMECMALSLSSNGSFPFGTRESYIKNAFEVALTTSQTFHNYGTKYQFANFAYVLERMTIDANKNVCTFSAQSGTVSITLDVATFTAPTSLIIGSAYNAGSIYTGKNAWNGYIYSCKIYDNGTLIRDYIPAKLSDGTIGLYDKLNGLLYINVGTGTFISGGYALDLPVNIGGTWKDANEAFVNIGGTWKAVETAFVNIGGTWKELG